MSHSLFNASLLSLCIFFVGCVVAKAPNVPTQAPYIVLSDNLDEPNGYGFCLDTDGRGKSELLHTHSCKPKTATGTPRNDRGHDVRFAYDPVTQQISSYAYEGLCMQVLIATGRAEFGLLACSDHPHQRFVYAKTDKTLRLATDNSVCVAVDTTMVPAGPWVKRALTLGACDKIQSALKQWLISPL